MSNLRRKINIDTDGNEMFKPNNLGYVAIGDGSNPNLDAFGRLRVSDPIALFESQLQYNKQPLLWEESITGGASTTHLPNESSVELTCGTASGDQVIRQTKQYFRYQAGKSSLIELTGVLGVKKTNVRQRLGYFDAQNGLFFEQDETDVKIVRRTYVSGAAVDNVITQDNWNIDKLDGTGPSGYTLDTTKTQIFVVDLQWLGVGRVRYGLVIDGNLTYVHEILNANSLTEVYMTTANLPLRYEITNTGTAASSTTMKQICCSVQSEGGFEDNLGFIKSASNGITSVAVTTRRPVLSIRPKTTFNSITNRGQVLPLDFELYAETNPAYFEIVSGGSLTGGSFSSVGTNSITEYDVSATLISNGEVITSGFVGVDAKTGRGVSGGIKNKLVLSNNIAGTTTDILTVVATSFTGTSNLRAAINFKEIY